MNLSWGDRAWVEEVVVIARNKGVVNRHFKGKITRCIHPPVLAPAVFNPAAPAARSHKNKNPGRECVTSTCHTQRVLGTFLTDFQY
jgi:hypothetical protein